MKSKLLFFALTIFALSSIQAQNWWNGGIKGEGPVVRKTIDLDDFDGFTLYGSGNVFLKRGNTQSVEIESHQNIIDNIERKVTDKYWKIKFEKNVRNYKKLNVYITIPTLTRAMISGSGDILSQDDFTGLGNLKVGISGSGNIRLSVEAESIDSKISGSGDIDLKGKSNSIDMTISGSGDINAASLVVNDCNVSISGSGDVKVHANERLNVRSSGSGDVEYKGRPRVNSKSSGSGNVKSMNN